MTCIALAAVVAVVVSLHIAFAAFAPPTRLWGDEEHYFALAHMLATRQETSLLPGQLIFAHRPELIAHIYSHFVDAGALVTPRPAFLSRVRNMNLAALAVLIAAVYAQGRALRLSRPAALAAAAVPGLFPWFAFHVHSLWPEILHAALLAVAFALCLWYLRLRRWWLLPGAGAILGYAMLLKGTVNSFVPVAAVFLLIATLWPAGSARWARRMGLGVLAVAAFSVGVAVVVGPQLLRNYHDGHGWQLAANRWRNIEWGLRMPVASDPPELRYLTWARQNAEYVSPGRSITRREEAAHERTMRFVRSLPVTRLVRRQVEKFARLMIAEPSFLEMAEDEKDRWGDPPPSWISALLLPARGMWYALLALSMAGLAVRGWRGAPFLFLSVFTAYYVAAMLSVPVKIRFAMQLVPTLCVFAAAVVDHVIRKAYRRRRASAATTG